jgi:raffinose/stachyose/melibiose transport system permease protein
MRIEQPIDKAYRKPFPFHIIVFLFPAVLIYTVFMAYPLLDSLRLSFFNQNGPTPVFVGLDNFKNLLFSDLWAPRFWNALRNNFVFFSIHMLVQNPLALLLAAILTTRKFKGAAIYRTLIFTPTTLSVVIVGFIWGLILNPTWGIFDSILKGLGLGSLVQPWLGSEQTSLIVISLISVWQWVGLPMILFIAALIAVPDELIEAAHVDGANSWRVFWNVRFPLVLPTIGIVSILTFVGNFNAFDLIYTVQGPQAAPNYATDIMGTLFYRTFYGVQLQPGNPTMGTTIAAMTFLVILTGVLIYLFGWQRRMTDLQY